MPMSQFPDAAGKGTRGQHPQRMANERDNHELAREEMQAP